MADEEDVRHIEAHGSVREQWATGADSQADLDDGYSELPTISNMRACMANIEGYMFTCIAANASTDEYDFELVWQSEVLFTDQVVHDLEQAQDMVDSGEVDEQSLIQEMVSGWFGVEATEVIGFSFSVGYPAGMDKEFRQ